jgi:hypothetical protein
MSNCRFGRCGALRRCQTSRRKSGACRARLPGVTRNLHLAARTRTADFFAPGLRCLRLADLWSGPAPDAHDRGKASVFDQRRNGLGQADATVKTLLGWRIAAVPDGRSARYLRHEWTYQMHLKPAARHRSSRSEPLCSDGSVHGGLHVAIGARVDWRTSSLGSRLKSGPMCSSPRWHLPC